MDFAGESKAVFEISLNEVWEVLEIICIVVAGSDRTVLFLPIKDSYLKFVALLFEQSFDDAVQHFSVWDVGSAYRDGFVIVFVAGG